MTIAEDDNYEIWGFRSDFDFGKLGFSFSYPTIRILSLGSNQLCPKTNFPSAIYRIFGILRFQAAKKIAYTWTIIKGAIAITCTIIYTMKREMLKINVEFSVLMCYFIGLSNAI